MAAESDRLGDLARQAITNGTEDAALPLLAAHCAREPDDVFVAHWQALLLRALDRREAALPMLKAAAARAPGDASLAQSLAQVALEAGLPAVSLFLAAIRLAPTRPELRLGLAAARLGEGDGEGGLDELGTMLAANAGWYDGHRQYAQLAALLGAGDAAMASYERAIAAFPAAGQLYFDAAALLTEGERYARALEFADRGMAAVGEDALLLQLRAGALDELGQEREAVALFDRLGLIDDVSHTIRRQRHLLRRGQAARAVAELEPWFAAGSMEGLWSYAALAWRMAGDARWEWLERDAFIATAEPGPAEIDLAALATLLRRLHGRSGRYLDQSVRQGTQTDGNLLWRIEPEIVALREALRRAIGAYRDALPPLDPGHPMLARAPQGRIRFTGSWSVRLGDAGFHEYHIHPHGWVSSAIYIAVPQALGESEGRLLLGGSPTDLGLGLAPIREIAPAPGRLAIFPSTMWHGTSPFAAGERLSVAYDVQTGP